METFIQYLKDQGSKEYAKHAAGYFKTGVGAYGEGDLFLGIRVPLLRAIAKEYESSLTIKDWEILLKNKYHEIRLVALLMMVQRYYSKKTSLKDQQQVLDLYLKNLNYVNNWDLVDLTAHKLLGVYVFNNPQEGKAIIWNLAQSNHLWSERVSVVCTWTLIKEGRLEETLKLSRYFLNHSHDLMHKACGWMLREVGKKDINILYQFLDKHYKQMPRTMLRYAIEKIDLEKRTYYMKKE